MSRAGFVALAALLGAGCSLPLELTDASGAKNTCSDTSECGSGAACVNDICVATQIDLENLLVEVRPRTNAAFGANTSYIFDPAEAGIPLVTLGGAPFIARMDPELPPPVAIREGRVRLHEDTVLEQGCPIGADRAVPAHITFYRVAPYVGLWLDPVPVNTRDANLFDIDLVRGTYDAYIEPLPVQGCNGGKPFPPAFRSGIDVTKDTNTLLIDLPFVASLAARIIDVEPPALDGWKFTLLEPRRGLPISANAELSTTAEGYLFEAQIVWPEVDAPIVRVSPPADTVQPTAYWKAFVVGGTATHPTAEYSGADLFHDPVKVTGNVFGSDGFTRVRASLSIQSTSLDGQNAENAAFAVDNVGTDENGVFSLLLPPGHYDLRAFPIDDGLAITDEKYDIGKNIPCFCGQPFVLDPKLTVGGAVKTPTNARLAGASVTIVPSQEKAIEYWTSTHALPPRTSREAPTVTNDDGNFTLLVDPGKSDLVIQAAEGSGFPWLVRPRLALDDDTQLASLTLTPPAILRGTVRDPDGAPVPDAEVNAWFPVREPKRKGGLVGTVVKIATTRTDAQGNYTLVMPSSI